MSKIQLPINKDALLPLINELNRLDGFVIANNKTDIHIPFPSLGKLKEKLEDILKNELKEKE